MSESLQAYCVKCKTKRNMTNAEPVYTKSGTPATKGNCVECHTGLYLMGETPAHADIPRPEVTERPARKKPASKAGKKPPSRPGKKASAGRKTSKSRSTGKSQSTRSATSGRRKIGRLVIVESPAKARSIASYLGDGYTVLASKGHVRDLLVTQLSVDVENDFEPKYRVPNEKRDIVNEIKSAADRAEEIFLATDPDREGEAIAWHLMAATEMPGHQVKRVVFNEITKSAVRDAFDRPRDIDMSLVNAQQARRILDRLVGYNITEILWNKVRNRLSAGRVQSIALRMVVDRERDIDAFVPQEYWTIDAELTTKLNNGKKPESFIARLVRINGEDVALHSAEQVAPHLRTLEKSDYIVEDIKSGTRRRRPSAPFTTSTLQQEASRRLGFNARRTMSTAQQLYEGIEIAQGELVGLITYMRTDSVNVSSEAQAEARQYIQQNFGTEYIPATAPQYKTKAKGAQEAHEAIRPTLIIRTPASIKNYLSRDQAKLYQLIWERFVASQMENAVYDTMRVEISAGQSGAKPYLFRSSGSRLRFPGFLALYEDARDEDAEVDRDEGRILPEMSRNDLLDLLKLIDEQHFTQPPPRYTEASLVRTLEEFGIGRPSTYAPTVAVIQDRDYVTKEDNRLVPTETGKIVSELLVKYFPNEMDYQFTARMEEQLDGVADGDGTWKPMLHEFYTPFEQRLKAARAEMPAIKQEEPTGRTCPTCTTGELVIKYGRWGKFIGCSNYPECRHTEPHLDYVDLPCPVCGTTHNGQIVERKTRKGRTFYGCSRYPDCDYSSWTNPKTANKSVEEDAEPLRNVSG